MSPLVVNSKLELHGAAASSSPHSVLYLPSSSSLGEGAVVYASNCIVNVATTPIFSTSASINTGKKCSDSDNNVVLYNTKKTLRTRTLPRNDWIRSITAMALLRPVHAHVGTMREEMVSISIIACAFSDGSITLWIHQKERGCPCEGEGGNEKGVDVESWREEVVLGNTAQGDIGVKIDDDDKHGTSITDIDGVYSFNNTADGHDHKSISIEVNIITSSAKGVHSYLHPITLGDRREQSSLSSSSSGRSVIGHYPTSSVKITTMDNQLLLGVGTALPRNNRIHFYTMCIDVGVNAGDCDGGGGGNNFDNKGWKHHGSVMGHLDWVSCLDWTVYEDSDSKREKVASLQPTLMLASGSQDARIRLWRFHPSTPCQEDDEEVPEEEKVGSGGGEDDDDDDDDDEDLIEEGEARMYIRYVNSEGVIVQSAVTLEALLIGHEEHVTSVAWRPNSSAPCIISSSMDRSILIWMEESNEEQEELGSTGGGGVSIGSSDYRKVNEGHGNVWVPVTRVGTAGGILGGSIGSSLLGFVNVLWADNGKQIIGHGFGGALYFWSRFGIISADGGGSDEDNSSNERVAASAMERWRANPGITGHFRGCHDISWEPTSGMYLLSVGADQTCRLWSCLPPLHTNKRNDNEKDATSDDTARIWKEVGRPQVHGYDLNTIVCIGTGRGEMLHRFVSGADEKEARAFDAPIQTLKLLRQLHGGIQDNDNTSGNEQRVERAFIPSLGLSNRATAADAMEEGFETGVPGGDDNGDGDGTPHGTSDSTNDVSNESATRPFLDAVAKSLPHERDLGVISLWPEVRKLHGHLTEMVCLASTAGRCKQLYGQVLVASSCKARNVEDAAIRVWDVEKNMCLDILKNGHKSTVVSLSFSQDGKYLASAGKDRRLCIWKRNVVSSSEVAVPTKFGLSVIVESAHKRIIWSVDFCPSNSNLLATGSRDGKLKIWLVSQEDQIEGGGEENSVVMKELYCLEPASRGDKKVEPITAIAFAPTTIQLEIKRNQSDNIESNESLAMVQHTILAMGLECGLIEIWAVPIDTTTNEYSAILLHSVPSIDCHIGAVKKLAWQPLQENGLREEADSCNSLDLTLASCSIDHGLRIYRFEMTN